MKTVLESEIKKDDLVKLKPCPKCGGNIELYSVFNPGISYSAFARCQKCKNEYPLPKVKLKTWKSNPIRISKIMISQAEKEWNKQMIE